MKSAIQLLFLLQCSMAILGAPIVKRDVNKKSSTLLYEANHDVVALSFTAHDLNDKRKSLYTKIFFIEADIQENGNRVDYGLFVLKGGIATKLLDSANAITVVNASKPIYFGTNNGIYVYKEDSNSAEKYGSVTDNILSIAAASAGDVIYYLNNQHQLYKLTENGHKSFIIDEVKNAQEITLDSTGNLFYYNEEKIPFVYNKDGVHAIKGIPDNRKSVDLLPTPIFIQDSGLFYADRIFYLIGPNNGTYEAIKLNDEASDYRTTAVSPEAGVMIFYAENNKIYVLNLIDKILQVIFEDIGRKVKSILRTKSNLWDVNFDYTLNMNYDVTIQPHHEVA